MRKLLALAAVTGLAAACSSQHSGPTPEPVTPTTAQTTTTTTKVVRPAPPVAPKAPPTRAPVRSRLTG